MSFEPDPALRAMLEEIAAIHGARGALVATVDGAFFADSQKSLDASLANDLAKTVRRMVVASATVGSPLAELLINFGPARMMIVPLREEATLAILLEHTATAAVRRLLKKQLSALRRMFGPGSGEPSESSLIAVAEQPEDEVDRLLAGELGPLLREVETCFTSYMLRASKTRKQAERGMRDQIREWLLCCNPSPYTFPLLIEGLSQLLSNDQEYRATFMVDVKDAMRNSQIWGGRR